MMRKAVLSLLLVTAFLGCSSGPGSFNGQVEGRKFSVKSSAAVKVPDLSSNNVGGYTVIVVLSDQPDICSLIQANKNPRNSNSYGLMVGTTDPNGKWVANLQTGTFSVQNLASIFNLPKNQNVGFAAYEQLDNSCKSTLPNDGGNFGASGTVTVRSLNLSQGSSVSGDYTVSMASGDKVSGSFDAPFCATNNSPIFNSTATCQ